MKLPLEARVPSVPSSRMPLEERIADEARFFKNWIENPRGTGAVSPSGRFLARAMARHVDIALAGPIIELGPGTGPVTEALLERSIAPERLVLVEYEPHFCRLLARRYPGVRIVHGDAYRLGETLKDVLEAPAAALVSSLPLRTRPERDRVALLRDAFGLLRPDAAFIQFTYGIASPMPLRSSRAPAFRAEVAAPVWLNLPPARVWVYRAAPAAESSPACAVHPPTRPAGGAGDRDTLAEDIRRSAIKARAEFLAKARKVKSEIERRHDEQARWTNWREGAEIRVRERIRPGR